MTPKSVQVDPDQNTTREKVARALYGAMLGDAALLEWPASNAETYRRLADVAMGAMGDDE